MTRRWRRTSAIGAALALVLALVWAFGIEPRRLVVTRADLALPGWPASLGTLKVAALADIHLGRWPIDPAQLAEVVARIDAEKPDLVLLLGDYVTGHSPNSTIDPERAAALLARLHPPLGSYAVLGNHDWWTDGARIRRALEQAGIRVLEEEAVEVRAPGGSFWLAGVADAMTRDAQPAAALAAVPRDAPVLILTHNPDIFPDVPARVSLTLAGHTHGGQVHLPLLGRLIVPSRFGERYAAGHIVEGGRHLFVTTGLGTSILPVRFGVPPEYALLGLHSQ